MRVLIACEESQAVCKAFRAKGHEAFSCDIQESSGGAPEWHIKGDVLPLINGDCMFVTEDGTVHLQEGPWDLLIAHPPCTYLTVTGNRWFDEVKYGEKARQRQKERYKAIVFFMQFAFANAEHIAIENPVGVMGSAWRPADQIIQPWQFGEPYDKQTALWLKDLPELKPTNVIERPERVIYASGKTMPKWYADLWSSKDRSVLRSKTFQGIANAMADQWGSDFPQTEKQIDIFTTGGPKWQST